MSIEIISTDKPEVVQAALGELKPADPKSADQTEPKDSENLEAAPADEKEPPKEDAPKDEETPEEKENDEDEEDLEAKADDKEGEKPKKATGFKKRIDKLNKRASDAEQRAEYWRQEALRTQGLREKTEANPKEPVKPELSAKPRREDFATIDAYEEARDAYVTKQAVDSFKKEQREKEQQDLQKKRDQAYMDRVAKFVKEEAKDFNEVLKSATAPLSLVMREAIRDSEVGPQIVYELAQNPEEAERIFSLSPTRQAVEIGRLETRFLEQTEPSKSSQERKTTAAPKPVTPVKGKGTVVQKDLDDPSLSQEEYNRIRNKQERERRTAAAQR